MFLLDFQNMTERPPSALALDDGDAAQASEDGVDDDDLAVRVAE